MMRSKKTYSQTIIFKKTLWCLLALLFILINTNAQTTNDSSLVTTPPSTSVNTDTSQIETQTTPAVPPQTTQNNPVSTAPATDTTNNTATIPPPVPKKSSFAKKTFIAEFMQKDVELKKSEIVSNVLRIVNASDKPLSFYLDISHPLKWKPLTNTKKLYETKAGDTLYIPIRVIPGTEFKGNMSYLINAFITNEEGKQITSDLFFASTKKIVKWEMSVIPRDRIYFLNNEKTTSFGLNIFNAGNENQDILLTLNEIGRNIVLQDTTGKIITKKFFDLNVAPEHDTNMFF
ncbi:MAG TPA: hypothetical protein VFM99_09300, partial [Chitinophagales bacterium]|nr:hypothetical protein [Chitinophagales bacterium]